MISLGAKIIRTNYSVHTITLALIILYPSTENPYVEKLEPYYSPQYRFDNMLFVHLYTELRLIVCVSDDIQSHTSEWTRPSLKCIIKFIFCLNRGIYFGFHIVHIFFIHFILFIEPNFSSKFVVCSSIN